MKVAIALTGHLRCWRQVFPNFKQQFIDRYNPDLFINSWDTEGYWVPEEGATGLYQASPALNVKDVHGIYKPKRLVIENIYAFLPLFEKRAENFVNHYHRKKNIISMFYKMAMGVNMIERHVMMTGTKYDLVIRMRPDMVLHQPLPELNPEKFYTVWHRNHVGGGTGDMFQAGTLENVSKFADIGMSLENIYQHTNLLCPHVCSEQWIDHLRLPWEEIRFNFHLQHTPNGQYKAAT